MDVSPPDMSLYSQPPSLSHPHAYTTDIVDVSMSVPETLLHPMLSAKSVIQQSLSSDCLVVSSLWMFAVIVDGDGTGI